MGKEVGNEVMEGGGRNWTRGDCVGPRGHEIGLYGCVMQRGSRYILYPCNLLFLFNNISWTLLQVHRWRSHFQKYLQNTHVP